MRRKQPFGVPDEENPEWTAADFAASKPFADVFPDLAAQDFTKVPLYATLERLYGVQMGRALSTIEVVQIAGDEANLLQLAPGASALRVQGTTFDQDDRATEVSRVLYRADRFRFSLESHRVRGELRHVIGPAADARQSPAAPATAG